MGFTKLDSGIVHSSVWSEPTATRVVWITLLAMANQDGFVSASYSGMLRASNVSEQEFETAIKSLEGPDPDSRSKEHDGRRIEKIEGGWLVLNYPRYREFSYSDSPEAVKKRRQREKKKQEEGGTNGDIGGHVPKRRDIAGHSGTSGGHSASASSSVFLNKEGVWGGITDEDMKSWQEAYPAVDLDIELKRALLWLRDNPTKKKKNYHRFLTNWFSRVQEKGGTDPFNHGNRRRHRPDDGDTEAGRARANALAMKRYYDRKDKEKMTSENL